MVLTDQTTEVNFESRYLLGHLDGPAKGVQGSLDFDTSNLSNASLVFSFSPATMVSNENYLTPDLRKKDCFGESRIEIKSTSIIKLKGENQYQFKGHLYIKQKWDDISFPFTAVPVVGGYDLKFQYVIREKKFKLKCAFHKRMTIFVKAYAKRKVE